MTASVLARWADVSPREIFFFAHPLVIPLTAPFAWVARDPLVAAGARESLFGAFVVALAFVGARAATGRASAGLVAALGLVLAQSRWRLATGGEEKEVALAFGGLALFAYMDHRGLWRIGPDRWQRARPAVRRITIGALLALAFAVHLVNGLLVLAIAVDVLLERSARREALREAAIVLGVAAALAAPFFLWLAIGLGGARTPGEIASYFLEYHLSGEFVSVPASVGERIVEAYGGGRQWLLGAALPSPRPALEALAAATISALLVVRALRASPRVVALLLGWIALLTAHFFFYEPWDPEAWGTAALGWAVVVAVGLTAPGRAERARLAVAAAVLVALAALDVTSYIEARRSVARAAWLAEGRGPAAAIGADLARWVDHHIEHDAILLVAGDRLVASYFHIYTEREPIVLEYLDRSRTWLRDEAALTTLSLRWYAPRSTLAELRARAARGAPVYLLTDGDEPLGRERRLGWHDLRLGRWQLPSELR